ncbi:MAG: PRC-barrel domain-containing protein [Armatimonadota bacterium]|nr:PRC-barrel domain-containing protein [bacterium]
MYQRAPEPGHDEGFYTRRPSKLGLLKELRGWDVTEGQPDFRGWRVIDRNGDDVGLVDDIVVDTDASEAIFATVAPSTAEARGRGLTLIPLDKVDLDPPYKLVKFHGTAAQANSAPPYKAGTTDYEPYYDYWSKEEPSTTEQPEAQAEEGAEREFTAPSGRGHTTVVVIRRGQEPRHGVEPGEEVIHEGSTVEVRELDEDEE